MACTALVELVPLCSGGKRQQTLANIPWDPTVLTRVQSLSFPLILPEAWGDFSPYSVGSWWCPGGKSHNIVGNWVSGVNNSHRCPCWEPPAICQLQFPAPVPQVNRYSSELWLPLFTRLSTLGATFALCPSLPCRSTEAMKYVFLMEEGDH